MPYLESQSENYIDINTFLMSTVPVSVSPTKPEFTGHVAEPFLIAGPVAVEVDRAVLSSLEHLHVTVNTYT